MKLRLLDEVLELGERGIALLWMEADGDVRPYAGMKLRDARGNVHAVASVSDQARRKRRLFRPPVPRYPRGRHAV